MQGLDTPDELSDAQADLELAFELRRDGVTSVVEQTEAALGDEGSPEATAQIATDMRQFLASDVLYARAQAEIEDVLAGGGARRRGAGVELPARADRAVARPTSRSTLSCRRSRARRARPGDATRGTEISSVIVRPGNVPLTPDRSTPSAQVPTRSRSAVLNGGTTDETDVVVAFEILGSTEPVEGETTIDRINPAPEGTAVIAVNGEIPEGRRPDADRHRLSRSRARRSSTTTRRPTRSASAARRLAVEPLSVAFLGPAGTFSDDALRAAGRARAGRRRAAARARRSTTR